MKKLLQLACTMSAITLLIFSCSTPKTMVNGGSARARFVGTWTIANVTYDGLVENAVQSAFNQAPPAAFVGSTWQLTNSGNGLITLSDGTAQTIFWSVNNGDGSGQTFQFKKIFQGDKAKNVEQGYSLIVSGNDGSNMTLKTPVAVGNRTGYVVYNFAKK